MKCLCVINKIRCNIYDWKMRLYDYYESNIRCYDINTVPSETPSATKAGTTE